MEQALIDIERIKRNTEKANSFLWNIARKRVSDEGNLVYQFLGSKANWCSWFSFKVGWYHI